MVGVAEQNCSPHHDPKNRENKEGAMVVLNGHAPNDLKISNWASPVKGSRTFQ